MCYIIHYVISPIYDQRRGFTGALFFHLSRVDKLKRLHSYIFKKIQFTQYKQIVDTNSNKMASLDKSLDDIISSSKRGRKFTPKRGIKKGSLAGGKVGKNLISRKPKPSKPTPKQAERILDASYATKVVVYGLPKDISSDAVKVCNN